MPGLQASAASSSWANMASYGNYQPANVEGGGNLLGIVPCCSLITKKQVAADRFLIEHEHSRVQELLC